jgi:hypothetical protein
MSIVKLVWFFNRKFDFCFLVCCENCSYLWKLCSVDYGEKCLLCDSALIHFALPVVKI